MKAAFIEKAGPPEVIRYGDLPDPRVADSQVLVRVKAVSINPIDTYIRSGLIKADLPFPYILGCDLAGTVERVGSKVTRFKPGDRVWGSNQGLLGRQGTFAELAAVDEGFLYPTPANVSDEDAAAVSLVGITAHLGLKRAQIKGGDTLFVNGGSGGVGSTVIQMGKAMGARVIATAGSDEKVEACRKLGADAAINYKAEKVADVVKQVAPNGVNIWWETTRDADFDTIVNAMAFRGRIVLMAGREARPQFPVGPFYTRDLALHGFVMFMAPPEEQRAAAEDMNRWLMDGKLKPRIDRVLPLSEAATAHRLQEESTVGKKGTVSGKIVLKP
jgi:NADPH2:quinone reductase